MLIQIFRNPDHIYWFIGSVIASIISLITMILLFKKYRIKKTTILRSISLTLLAFSVAIFADWITLLAYQFNDRPLFFGKSILDLGTTISFSFNALGNVFLLTFIEQVFDSDISKSIFRTFLKIGELVVVGLMVYTIVIIDEYLKLIGLVIHVLLSLIIYSILSTRSFNLMKEKTEDFVKLRSIGFIAISGILLLISIIIFVTHEVIVILGDNEYYTLSFGWFFAGIAAFCIYIGYVSPDWFQRFLIKMHDKKK